MACPIRSRRLVLSAVWLLLLLLLLSSESCRGAALCPRSCTCPRPTELHCTFRSLPAVPHNVSPRVERLNLGFNRISRVSEKSFSGLTRLEMLLIHGNDLHSLPDGAFKDLSALQMLKLSYNHLREVSRHTFVGLWSLARLHLDHNGLESIDPDTFHGLTSLRLLQLEGNRLKHLHSSTFSTFSLMGRFHLSTLRHLYLSNNSLSAVHRQMLDHMPQLENLFLQGNPWICDCSMRWIHGWLQTAPGVLKCKKDRSLPGGELCPTCSSPSNLHQKPLQTLDNMVCSSPVIKSLDPHAKPEEIADHFTFLDEFIKPHLGNITLELSDEHGNEVHLQCGIGDPRDASKISFEQVDGAKMASNVTLSLDLECDVDRETYERLWRLIAYYSSVPVHLKRGIMLTKDPNTMYAYRQDPDKDALYFTGMKANILALPSWLMQEYLDLQLNRHGSSAKKVKLILTTLISQDLDLEMVHRQPRLWVRVQETGSTHKTVILGKSFDLQCSAQSSSEPVITWILPDGTKLTAPSGSNDERLSISADGRLVVEKAEHSDTGSYYCTAKVDEDVAVLAFYVAVQDSSNPQPDENQATPTELFAGNSLNLDCEALGSPNPEVQWIIPNGNVVSFRSNSSRVLVYSNGTLHISQSLPPDNGFYKCIALNQYGVDSKVAKVTVNRRPGMVRPLRRIPMRPQSAAGFNTRIKVELNGLEDGSGDVEEALKLTRKLIPVRGGVHPSRNTWRRPPIMLQRPNLQSTESGKNILDHRRRISLAKINPERWANIWSKMRVKNGRFATTASPRLTTQFRKLTTSMQESTSIENYATTYAHEAIEGSSDGAREKANQESTTMSTFEAESTYSFPSTSLEALTSQRFPNLQQTTSSNAFFLPQTTSAPLQAVTLWQATLNTQEQSSKSMTSPREQGTELDGDKPADSKRPKEKGNRKNKTRLSKLNNGKSEEVVPTVVPVTSRREDEMIFSSQKPKSEAIISVVSPTTAQIWNKQQSSKRRNGNRKKKPNRRKNKLKKTVNIDDLYVERVQSSEVASSELNIQVENGQKPTSSTMDHKTSTKAFSKSFQTRPSTVNQVQGFITTAFPETRPDTLPSNSQQEFTSPRLAPVKPSAQIPMQNAVADSSSEELRHARGKLIQSRQGNMAPEGRKHLANGSWEQSATRSSPLASLTEREAGEMYRLEDKSELVATTGIDFEVLSATMQPESEPTNQDYIGNQYLTASTTALPMSTNSLASPKWKESDKPSISINESTKKPQNSRESIDFSNPAFPQTTIAPQMFKVTSQIFPQSQQTQEELVNLNLEATTQTPSILVSLDTDEQNQAAPTNSVFLQTFEAKTSETASLSTEKSTLLPLFQTFTTKKALISKGISKTDEEDQNNERNSLLTTQLPPSISSRGKTIKQDQNNGAKSVYFFNSLPQNSTLTPVVLGESTQKATSMSTSGKTVKQDQNIEAESTNFYNSVAQNSTYSPNLSEDSTEKDSSVSITQKSQSNLVKTPTAAFSDFVTQSSNHRMDQSINSNPSIPVINVRTTLAPNYNPILVHSWTERPRARTTPRLPARRGKPWITRSNFHTTSVKAETDAVLPCAANGEPKPFLSWTKVSTGTSIPQNTILQRFEVHENGTLIIRNTQPVDGGEYICTVQNQHGSDRALTNLVVLSQHPKILQPRHRDFSVNLGSNIDIDCQVEGHPTPRVTWVLPNHVQIAASAFGVVPNRVSILPNGTLRIVQAGFSDRGIYKCVGSSSSGADTVSVRLYVSAMPPVLRQIPIENITAAENGIVFLHCSANGSPQPMIRWTTPDNIQLTSSQYLNGRKTMVFPNGTLFMQSLSQKNAGRYECLASNVLGTSRRTVNLAVKRQALMAKASIAVSSATLTEVVYGGELRLDCQAEGEPRPRVIWRTPSRKLVDSHYSFDPRIRVFPNGSISVGAVTDADAGDYLCVARNRLGDDYVLLRVLVLTKPAKIEQKPQRSSQEVVYGGDLKVDCVASGLPNPEISWALPDGTMVNPDKDQDRPGPAPGRRRRYVVFDNGTLFFNDVGMREEGDYTCYAENQLGKDEMKIHVKVKTTAFRPQIRNKLQTSTVQVIYGENFTLSCDAEGEPAPVFTWMSPINRVIFPNKDKYQVLSNGKLTVLKAQRSDSGDYTCSARNNVGQDTKVVKVEVLVIPPVISNTIGLNSEVSVVQNERIWLDCVASGTPTPRIMWVLPGNVILPASYRSKRMTVYQNGTLEIHTIKRSDAGLLACIARNEGGEVRLAVNLNVKEANSNRVPVSRNKMETVSLNGGNAITLSCGLESDSFSSLTWVLPNGTPLLSGARFAKVLHRQDGSLVISNPSLAEAGTYRCLGHNNGRQVEQIVQLQPGGKPEIANRFDSSASFDVKEENANRMLISGNTMETASLTAGNAITLSCGYEDNSLSSLTWVLPNGTPLVSGARFAKFSHRQDGSLVISNPTLAETGTYRCSGRDNGRQVERIVQLELGRKTENVNHYNTSTGFDFKEDNANQMLVSEKKMETVLLTAGNAMTLTCNSEGDSFSSLTWVLPNGSPLGSGARFAKFFHRQDGSLVISNPTLADAGIYRCLGRNNGRQIEQIVQLEPGRKPQIMNRYNSSVSIIHGETLMLHCVTDGDPLRLTWTLPSEVVLNRPQKAGRYSLLPNGTLAIQQISVYDRGLYVCRAANEYGSTSMSASVIVIAYPPRITVGPNAVTVVKSGVAVQLNCIATGIPEVEVAWETPDKTRLVVNSQPRLFRNIYIHPRGSLVIHNPTQRDAGVYRCTARNIMGTDSRTTQLQVFR